jgi:hypothetical protein
VRVNRRFFGSNWLIRVLVVGLPSGHRRQVCRERCEGPLYFALHRSRTSAARLRCKCLWSLRSRLSGQTPRQRNRRISLVEFRVAWSGRRNACQNPRMRSNSACASSVLGWGRPERPSSLRRSTESELGRPTAGECPAAAIRVTHLGVTPARTSVFCGLSILVDQQVAVKSGSERGTRTPDQRIMIPLL